MTPDLPAEKSPADLATVLSLGRARHRGRPWGPSARTLLATCGEPAGPPGAATQPPAKGAADALPDQGAYFQFVDDRFRTPVTVFLEFDPTAESGYPGFPVRKVTLEAPGTQPGLGVPAGVAIGRNPGQLDRFRAFRSDGGVAAAGFILIEPRYVGPNWPAYLLTFQPDGRGSGKARVPDGRAVGHRG